LTYHFGELLRKKPFAKKNTSFEKTFARVKKIKGFALFSWSIKGF